MIKWFANKIINPTILFKLNSIFTLRMNALKLFRLTYSLRSNSQPFPIATYTYFVKPCPLFIHGFPFSLVTVRLRPIFFIQVLDLLKLSFSPRQETTAATKPKLSRGL